MGYQSEPEWLAVRCPVNDMSWEQLQDFLQEVEREDRQEDSDFLPRRSGNMRLKEGRRPNAFLYSGSNDLAEVGWLSFNSGDQHHDVGLLKPNELGLYDMNGNAWELCEDWYDPKFYALEISPRIR
jgi:hypothetical protein